MPAVSTDQSLQGRTAVVTGALGRLGPIWVRALAGAGATVVGVDLAAPADGGAGPYADLGGRVRLARADVTDRAALETVARGLDTAADVLVCSAGIDQPPESGAATWRIEELPVEAFAGTLDVNLTGTFATLQALGAPMAAAGRGAIVTVGSLYASTAPDPSFYDHMPLDPPFLKPPAYGASKAGVLSLTRYFARLWGPSGVRVNALSPGGVLGGQDPEFLRKYSARVPLRRLAEAADLDGPLLFLASDASSYLTGHELRVDGGFTA